ncbi:hypothetical protein Glove_13g155 [Diversispora epigaea]|uniref:GATA-type domain-containing protein n=1 Tax=Diversispora epigaea TaxID=1348612 RepID=A0A397JPW3_9GLOM|nr:hypothetical protein Glove_13g155 [Diversispora epigaea]
MKLSILQHYHRSYPIEYYWMAVNNGFYQQSSSTRCRCGYLDSPLSPPSLYSSSTIQHINLNNNNQMFIIMKNQNNHWISFTNASNENFYIYHCSNYGSQETPAWRRDLHEALLCNTCDL